MTIRHNLLATTVMTASERRLGRYLRAPEGHEESGTPANNSQGNSGGTAGGTGDSNNTGTGFDHTAFWSGSDDADGETPATGSAANPPASPGSTEGGQPQSQGSSIAATIAAMTFGDVMTQEAATKLAEGDPADFHKNLNVALRGAVQNSLIQSVGIMKQMRTQILEEVESKIQGSLGNRDNDAALIKAFPSAANPAVKPIVKNIFDRAMQVTKGNRDAAVSMTREMLKFQTGKMSEDLGIPPASSGDSSAQVPSNVNWAEELGGLVGRE